MVKFFSFISPLPSIKLLKKNKATGPDETIGEFFKYLDVEIVEHITDMMNYCWEHSTVPENMDMANIVTIYKKGHPENS